MRFFEDVLAAALMLVSIAAGPLDSEAPPQSHVPGKVHVARAGRQCCSSNLKLIFLSPATDVICRSLSLDGNGLALSHIAVLRQPTMAPTLRPLVTPLRHVFLLAAVEIAS